MNATAWRITLAATALTAIAMGLRASGGLFVSPLNTATGLGLATLSLFFAAGQLALGLAQPALGAWADRAGAARVVAASACVLAAATALLAVPAWVQASASLVAPALAAALVASAVANGAVGGSALLVGEVNRRVPAERAGLAVGIVGAGASLGQLLIGPATQAAIEHAGFGVALLASGALALLALPLAWPLRRSLQGMAPVAAQPIGPMLRNPVFLRAAASFGACGFHVAFLGVHMPGVIERCGLPAALAGTWIALAGAANIGGSVAMGLAMRRHDHALLLALIYAIRAAAIAMLLWVAPTEEALLLFAVVMGASHMATLPPTAQLVAREFGVTRLSALMGFVMLVHQVGGFFGVWLGGWAAQATGSDRALWIVDLLGALLAACLVWPLRRRTAAGHVEPVSA